MMPGSSLVLLLTVLLSQLVQAEESRPDILGIRLGDTFETVAARLRAHYPPAFIQEVPGDIGNIEGSLLQGLPYRGRVSAALNRHGRARHGAGTDTIVAYGLAPPSDGQVVIVYRRVNLQQSLPAATLRQMLEEKYGPPLVEDAGDSRGGGQQYRLFQMLSWSRDVGGQPLAAEAARRCSAERTGHLLSLQMRPDSYGKHSHCGFILAVFLEQGEHVQQYSTLLYDANMIRAGNARTVAYARAEAERIAAERADQEREAAAGAERPKL
ncbi:hypothetical protein [Kineobactrum salinum]|uniref:Uncharacterized protein n=1 Tax=Kineobactrum salinum TaxID=2708301 RepID=A0A6C0U4D4_9GAMM|nr:hypothetical protein [Kineobactrum salinum]QIB66703.1 hypothetical protein G3T16_16175 [Kineobactrum salinum]